MIWNHPRLCLTQIWLLLDSNLQVDAQSYFDRLGNFLEKNLRSEFLAVRALHAAMTHQPELALQFAKRAQRSLKARDPFIQTYVSFGMGAAQKMGLNFFEAEQSLRGRSRLHGMRMEIPISPPSRLPISQMFFIYRPGCSTRRLFVKRPLSGLARTRRTPTIGIGICLEYRISRTNLKNHSISLIGRWICLSILRIRPFTRVCCCSAP